MIIAVVVVVVIVGYACSCLLWCLIVVISSWSDWFTNRSRYYCTCKKLIKNYKKQANLTKTLKKGKSSARGGGSNSKNTGGGGFKL